MSSATLGSTPFHVNAALPEINLCGQSADQLCAQVVL